VPASSAVVGRRVLGFTDVITTGLGCCHGLPSEVGCVS
jgi:hypothetical protein